MEQIFLLVMLTMVAIWDGKWGKIPNEILFFGWMMGIPLFPQPDYLISSLIPIAFLLPFWKRRMIGAGDVKLFALIWGYQGIEKGLKIMLVSFLLGGIFGLISLVACGALKKRLCYLGEYVAEERWGNKPRHYGGPVLEMAQTPLALWILLSFLFWMNPNG